VQEKSSTIEEKNRRRFLELWAIAEERGWTKADVARAIFKSPALVTMIIKGRTDTSEGTVALFEQAVLSQKPAEVAYPESKDTALLLHDLAELDHDTRTHVIAAVRQMVAVYPKMPRRKRNVSKGPKAQ